MKLISSVIFTILSCNVLIAQEEYKAALYGQNFNAGSYIQYIRVLEDNESKILDNNQPVVPGFSKGMYYQVLAWYYSYVGEVTRAEQLFSKEVTGNDTTPINFEAYKKIKISQDFELFKKATEHTKIVMINEAHHQPQHRVFTYNCLEELYRQGFRYLLLEALSNSDSLINKRGYPEIGKSGTYTKEPLYGQLIRKAINLGFKIVAYDYGSQGCVYNPEQPFYCANKRELYASKNIQKILNQDSTAKIIIHCGYDHVNERTNDDWIKLAEFIKIISSVDPVTVNQTFIRERGNGKSECHEYKYITSNNRFDKISFVVDSSNQFYSPSSRQNYSDIYLITPPFTINKYNRPSYLDQLNDVSKYIFIPSKISKKILDGYLAQVFGKAEVNGVPFDQFIINNANSSYAVYLPKGKYSIVFRNKNGEVIYETEILI